MAEWVYTTERLFTEDQTEGCKQAEAESAAVKPCDGITRRNSVYDEVQILGGHCLTNFTYLLILFLY